MKRIVFVFSLMFIAVFANAGAPTCHTHSSGNYCKYYGPVSQIYINSSNQILLYFEEPVDVSEANSVGMGISSGIAASFNVTENPEFAKLFYSTALAAQASGRNVSIQMRGSYGGYLKFDRIWLPAP